MDNGIYLKLTRDQLQTVVAALCEEAGRAEYLSGALHREEARVDKLVHQRDEARENLDSALATIDELRDRLAEVSGE